MRPALVAGLELWLNLFRYDALRILATHYLSVRGVTVRFDFLVDPELTELQAEDWRAGRFYHG
jgi:hypothetical protein